MINRQLATREIAKIMAHKEFSFPQNRAMAATWILGHLKGVNLKVFDLQSTSDLCDYYVVGSANNKVQAQAMANEIIFHLRPYGSLRSKEGMNEAHWILLDLSDIIVHIFQEEARQSYALEELWKGAKTLKIPDEYYFS